MVIHQTNFPPIFFCLFLTKSNDHFEQIQISQTVPIHHIIIIDKSPVFETIPSHTTQNPQIKMPSFSTVILIGYITLVLSAFTYTFINSYTFSQQYFSAILIYLDDPSTNFILYNLVLAASILAYRGVVCLFFVESKQNQNIKITQKLKSKIFDLIFFIYLTRAQLHLEMFTCVIMIILIFVVHNHAIFRSQYLIHTPTLTTLSLNYRLLAFMLLLLFMDYQILRNCFFWIASEDGIAAMFMYYMFSISMSILEPALRYFVDFYEKFTYHNIANLDQYMIHICAILNISRYIAQILLALWITKKFGFAFFFIITAMEFVYELNTTIKAYRNMKKLTDTIKNLKRIDDDALKEIHDRTCMICFHDMHSAVLLPCKHAFHEECLRQWIIKNSNHFCPKCKQSFNFDTQDQERKQPRLERQPNNNLRRHIDALAMRGLDPANNRNQRVHLNRIPRTASEDKLNRRHPSTRKQFAKDQQSQTFQKHEGKLYPEEDQQSFLTLAKEVRRLPGIGSLPFCLPTDAIYRRTHKDVFSREIKRMSNQDILVILKKPAVEQILQLPE